MEKLRKLLQTKDAAITMLAVLVLFLAVFITAASAIITWENNGTFKASQTHEGKVLINSILEQCDMTGRERPGKFRVRASEAVGAVVNLFGSAAENAFYNVEEASLTQIDEGWVLKWKNENLSEPEEYFINAKTGNAQRYGTMKKAPNP